MDIKGFWRVRNLYLPHHTMFLSALTPSLSYSRIKADSMGLSKMMFWDKDMKTLFKVNQTLTQPFINVGR